MNCRTCGIFKLVNEYYTTNKSNDCKICFIKKSCDRYRLRKLYPKTEPFYNCEICNKRMENKRLIHLDHDHKTGNFRGFLCPNCNKGLGFFNDDIGRLKSVIKYLQKNKGNSINEDFEMETENYTWEYMDNCELTPFWENSFC